MRKTHRTSIELGIILACAFILHTLFLSWMPGLQADSAWKALRSFKTVHQGNFILTGITSSNGALQEYLFALCYRLFGINVLSIRLPFAVMNILAVLFTYLFVKRLYNESAGLTCALMLSVYPWFVIFLRLAWPPSTIPFVTMLTLYLLSVERRAARFFAGAIVGMACYDYQFFICLPVVLLILYAIYHRGVNISRSSLIVILLGALIGYVPKIICLFCYGDSWSSGTIDSVPAITKKAVVCIPFFLRIMDGSFLFLKTTGRVAFPVISLNSLILIASMYLLTKSRSRIDRPLVVSLLVFYGLIIIPMTLTSIRYFTFMMLVASLISGLGVYHLIQKHTKLGSNVLVLFVGMNLFYITVNFFIEYYRTGGRPTTIEAGNYLEVSHVHMRTDVLYNALDTSVPVVVIPSPFISNNLKFYDLNERHFAFDNVIRPDYNEFYYIYYASDQPPRETVNPKAFPDYEVTRELPELRNFNVYRFRKARPQRNQALF
jgi:hypothetical protein